MKMMWKQYFKDDSGATSIEYALIAAFIALALVAGAQAVGISLVGVFTGLGLVLA